MGAALGEPWRGADPYDYAAMSPTPFRNSPEADAAREAALREAQIKAEAREAGVFFQLASRGQSSSPAAVSATPAVSPFDIGLAAPPPSARTPEPARTARRVVSNSFADMSNVSIAPD